MPDLPTITVTQAQADRMLAAFGTTTAYKTWLKKSIIDLVLQVEGRKLDDEAWNAKDTQLSALRSELEA